jgi:outer membrane receptor protein involved in Fe transport
MEGFNCNVNMSAGTRLENGSANFNYRHNNFGINAFFSGNAQLESGVPFSMNRVSSDSARQNITTLTQTGISNFLRNGFRSGLGFDWNITKRDNITGSVGFNQFYSRGFGLTNQDQVMQNVPADTESVVNTIRNSDSWSRVRSLDLSLEYKKKFRKEGQELDVIYNSTNGRPNSFYDQTQLYDGESLPYMGSESSNPGTDDETDISLDYSQPISESFLIEAGSKYMFHDINSIADTYVFTPVSDDFIYDPLQSYDLRYNMKIYAGYISTNFKLLHFLDVKAGLRYEHTDVSIDFPNTSIPSYGTFVPSVVLSHNFSQNKTLKLSYAKRIQRPEYRDLNPFMNLSDPYNITTGNPLLKPEIGHNFELGYNTAFKTGGNLYVALIERISTQDVERMTTFYPTYEIGDSLYSNVSITTNQNVGTEFNSGISISGSYPISKKLNIRGNLIVTHRYIVSSITGDMSTGLRGRLNMNATYELPKDLVIEAFGFYNFPSRNIQGKVPQFFIYTFAFRKMFWDKKASIGFTTINPFGEYIRQLTTISTEYYNSSYLRQMPFRSFGVSFTYKFGKIEFNKPKEEDDNNEINPENSNHN